MAYWSGDPYYGRYGYGRYGYGRYGYHPGWGGRWHGRRGAMFMVRDDSKENQNSKQTLADIGSKSGDDNNYQFTENDFEDEEDLSFSDDMEEKNMRKTAAVAPDPSVSEEEYLKKIREDNSSVKVHTYEKVKCKTCNGHTILRDGEAFESKHTANCTTKTGCDACGHPEEKEEEECSSESSSSCSSSSSSSCEEEEKPAVCKPEKRGDVYHVYVTEETDICKKLRASITKKVSTKFCFEHTVVEGNTQKKFLVEAKTVPKSKNTMALDVTLVPIADNVTRRDASVEGRVFKIANTGKKLSKLSFKALRSGMVKYRDAGIPALCVQSGLSVIEQALLKLKQ